MHCNHSRYIITDTLKIRKASEVAESIFQKLICTHGTNIKEIHSDLDTAFKNQIVSTMFKSLGITVTFCSVQSHQINPAEHAIQGVSQILVHYITRYGNLWCIMANMASFCLNIFPIGHLQNLFSYEILFGRNPTAISNLQLEGDKHWGQPCYHFTDYLDLLNERMHAMLEIVKQNHNETISFNNKVLTVHHWDFSMNEIKFIATVHRKL